MEGTTILELLKANREIIEVVFMLIFALSSTVRGVIAQVSEMLQTATKATPEDAMDKAIQLLQKKIPLPAPVLRWLIQFFFNTTKKEANKELETSGRWAKSVNV